MPFCSQCGTQVTDTDAYCGRCGAPQPVSPRTGPRPPLRTTDPLDSMNPRTASILCYIPGIGWIAAIVVLASTKFRHNRVVRFHAFQGLYLFVAWLLTEWVAHPFFSFMMP